MKNKISVFIIYSVVILVFIVVFIQGGTELIVRYEMWSTDTYERHMLADDMGFGLLLMFGLIPEIILGAAFGWMASKKIVNWYQSRFDAP